MQRQVSSQMMQPDDISGSGSSNYAQGAPSLRAHFPPGTLRFSDGTKVTRLFFLPSYRPPPQAAFHGHPFSPFDPWAAAYGMYSPWAGMSGMYPGAMQHGYLPGMMPPSFYPGPGFPSGFWGPRQPSNGSGGGTWGHPCLLAVVHRNIAKAVAASGQKGLGRMLRPIGGTAGGGGGGGGRSGSLPADPSSPLLSCSYLEVYNAAFPGFRAQHALGLQSEAITAAVVDTEMGHLYAGHGDGSISQCCLDASGSGSQPPACFSAGNAPLTAMALESRGRVWVGDESGEPRQAPTRHAAS